MLSEWLGQIYIIFKVPRKIQESKMKIWKYIKIREKSEKPHKANTIRKKNK